MNDKNILIGQFTSGKILWSFDINLCTANKAIIVKGVKKILKTLYPITVRVRTNMMKTNPLFRTILRGATYMSVPPVCQMLSYFSVGGVRPELIVQPRLFYIFF